MLSHSLLTEEKVEKTQDEENTFREMVQQQRLASGWSQPTWVTASLPSIKAEPSYSFSKPQFSQPQNGNNNNTHLLRGLGGRKESMHLKHLAGCLGH